MEKKTIKIIAASIVVILCVTALICFIFWCYSPEHRLHKQIVQFQKIVSGNNLDSLSLSIYYSSPYDTRYVHWSLDQLLEAINNNGGKYLPGFEYLIDNNMFWLEVNESNAEERYNISRDVYKDLLGEITIDKIKTVKKPVGVKETIDARIYYVFKLNDRTVLDVVMWSCGSQGIAWKGKWLNIYVNGVEVEGNKAFYDVIMPFLPKEYAIELENFVTNTLPDNYRDPVWERDDTDAKETSSSEPTDSTKVEMVTQ